MSEIQSAAPSQQDQTAQDHPIQDHTVQSGDTLSGLADQFDTTLSSVVGANPQISNPDLIQPGQVVQIPQAASETGGSVTVQPGDTLNGIAQQNGTTLDNLLQVNPQIQNPDRIFPGQQIQLPAPPTPPAPTPPGSPDPSTPAATHTVGAGDTLSNIATQYDVSLPALLDANPQVQNPNLIYPGQQINIPNQVAPEPTPGPVEPTPTPAPAGELIYSDQVSPEFANKVQEIAGRLDMDPNHLMAVMHFETGGTFSPSARNGASGATGLIQFLPSTARGLGTTTGQLAQMSAVEQLDVVEQYLQPYSGRMDTIEDAYMAVFYPASIGKSNQHVLFSEGSTAYRQNAPLDTNRDGNISKGEAASFPRQRLNDGLAQLESLDTTAPTPGSNDGAYTVQSGDTLGRIADRFGVSLNDLLDANPQITNSNLIFSGQTINLPAGSGSPSDTPGVPTPSNVEIGAIGSDAPLWKKDGANVANARPEITSTFDDIVAVWSQNGSPTPVVTSGNDGRHSNGSLHYSDLAVDLRVNNISDSLSQQIADDLQARLGSDYDVIFERFPGNEANDHIHVEYDPN